MPGIPGRLCSESVEAAAASESESEPAGGARAGLRPGPQAQGWSPGHCQPGLAGSCSATGLRRQAGNMKQRL